MLREYGELVSDAPERLFKILEKQVETRLALEKAESRRANFRLMAAFLLFAAIITGGLFLVAAGHDWAGASLVGVNVVGLAGVFVYGARRGQ